MSADLSLQPIGRIKSCYKEKFGVPRQAGLVPSAESIIELEPPFDTEAAFQELERFSHIWVIFLFHQVPAQAWQPTVRPPRLGGNRKVGVFASRSPFRPNRIGLSAVRLLGVECEKQRCALRIAGGDMVDGTPVLDIKPYLPYADRVDATPGYTEPLDPEQISIEFSGPASMQLEQYEKALDIALRPLIIEILRQDPRPAYREDSPGTEYGMSLYNFNLRFQYVGKGCLRVIALEPSSA